jgi:class 3 adenylate cyclase
MDRREERRLVACLFIDIVGSTELNLRLGSERLKSALESAFAELRALIEREGGTVEKYVGDGIYALFGSPLAHEDDPARALRAADAARRWARTRERADVPLAVRVGVEIGEAVVDLVAAEGSHQQMSVGAVVNTAARVQQHAEPGQVLVGPLAHAATEEIAAFRALGEFELKGLGRIPVWALEDMLSRPRRRTLPFVGRDSEIELLRFAQRRARDRSVLVLVSGPPGQGKTRLVEEFTGSLERTRVLKAHCRPDGEIGTLAPLRQLLIADQPESSLAELVALALDDAGERTGVRDALAHSAGIRVSSALTSIGKNERDDEIQNAWRRFVRGLAARSPLAIWVEDVHWASAEILGLLDRLSLSGEPLLVIITARPEFADAATLRPRGDRFFIELEGLDATASNALAASAGASTQAALARAQGNPLFIVELARTRENPGQLPITLLSALGARLDELDVDDRALLAHAAVVGEAFSPSDVAVLARRETSTIGGALARLADRHYIDALDGRYRFHHSLLRDVAYGRLLVADRMRLHARYARERAAEADAEVLAHHWWAALGGPDAVWVWRDEPNLAALRGQAFGVHLAAGRGQAQLFAIEPAAALLERAFSLANDEHERGAARLALGDAFALDLRGDEAWQAYREAREHFAAAGAVPAAAFLGALKIRLRVGAFKFPPSVAEVATLASQTEPAARASGDLASLARALVYTAFKDMDPSKAGGDQTRINEALRLAEDADPLTRREILGWHANDLVRRMDLDRARGVFDEIDALPVVDNELDRMEHLRGRALLAHHAGDLEDLSDLAQQLVAMSRRMGPHLRTHADLYAAQTALARGEWEQLLRLATDTDQLVRRSPGTAFCTSATVILALGAVAHARAGRPDEARALAQQIRSIPDEDLRRPLEALALAFTGARVEADPSGGQYTAVVAVASRAHALALATADELASRSLRGAHFFAALAEAMREEIERDEGGPPAKHVALRALGYVGWSELLGSRA